ncbi:CvpA family protein [Flavobacterium sp.]|uniref:CvpA family protein n=1 Tax=Flavobacterium sp. TaxID=239 RepID=UPI002B4AE087|nr:CvpA family protein [Flavobacterium sp.]HLF52363.1 CvpA family protein [Flavobacterium sp.]
MGKDKNLKIGNGLFLSLFSPIVFVLLSLRFIFILDQMGFLDIILGGLLLYGFIRGIWNGFFVELASLLSLLVGIYVAIKFSHFMKAIVENHVSWNPKTIQITAFVLTFILVVVAITFLAKILTNIASFAFLGWLNKLAGGVFGILKTALIISISLKLFQKINSNNSFAEKETLDNSLFYNPIQKISAVIYPSLEEWFMDLKTNESKTEETGN